MSQSDDDAHFDSSRLEDGTNSNSNGLSGYSARRATVSYANRTSSHPLSNFLATEAKHHINRTDKAIHVLSDEESECCADSGATHHMLNKYEAFVSYHPCKNRVVTLGDESTLPVLGTGTAKFSLNRKVILIRNALHVPGLRAPLYSLRRHRLMAGCGYFSHFEIGSYILFPDFVIKVDDSKDNLISFKSIGLSKVNQLDYAEPRTISTTAARPATVIPDDDSSTHSPDTNSPHQTTLSDDELIQSSNAPLPKRTLQSIHHDVSKIPEVPPVYTPGPAEKRTLFDSLQLHRIFGCRKFRNQRHIIAASKNASLIKAGEMPKTLGDFTTINNPNKGKPLTRRRKYLDKVHLDIVYGDCLGLGGFRYAMVLVDVATCFCWVFGMSTLTSADIIGAFVQFQIAAGGLPVKFHADFDQKLIGGAALKWIQKNNSKIIAAPRNRQSSNGLVERTWQTLL